MGLGRMPIKEFLCEGVGPGSSSCEAKRSLQLGFEVPKRRETVKIEPEEENSGPDKEPGTNDKPLVIGVEEENRKRKIKHSEEISEVVKKSSELQKESV